MRLAAPTRREPEVFPDKIFPDEFLIVEFADFVNHAKLELRYTAWKQRSAR